jgi:hypothetical protein
MGYHKEFNKLTEAANRVDERSDVGVAEFQSALGSSVPQDEVLSLYRDYQAMETDALNPSEKLEVWLRDRLPKQYA